MATVLAKTVIVPVPITKTAPVTNNIRPVALTAQVMKSFEKLFREILLSKVEDHLEPLQFAYRTYRGVDDATGTLLNIILGHLKGTKTFVRLC